MNDLDKVLQMAKMDIPVIGMRVEFKEVVSRVSSRRTGRLAGVFPDACNRGCVLLRTKEGLLGDNYYVDKRYEFCSYHSGYRQIDVGSFRLLDDD